MISRLDEDKIGFLKKLQISCGEVFELSLSFLNDSSQFCRGLEFKQSQSYRNLLELVRNFSLCTMVLPRHIPIHAPTSLNFQFTGASRAPKTFPRRWYQHLRDVPPTQYPTARVLAKQAFFFWVTSLLYP